MKLSYDTPGIFHIDDIIEKRYSGCIIGHRIFRDREADDRKLYEALNIFIVFVGKSLSSAEPTPAEKTVFAEMKKPP